MPDYNKDEGPFEESKNMPSISPVNNPRSDTMGTTGKSGLYKPAKFKKKYVKIKTNIKKSTMGLNLQGLHIPADHPNAGYNVNPDASILN